MTSFLRRRHLAFAILPDFDAETQDRKTESDHEQHGHPVRRVPTDDSLFGHAFPLGCGPSTTVHLNGSPKVLESQAPLFQGFLLFSQFQDLLLDL